MIPSLVSQLARHISVLADLSTSLNLNKIVHFHQKIHSILIYPAGTNFAENTKQDSTYKAIKLQKERDINILPVIEKERLVGIVTDKDIKKASVPDGLPLDLCEAIYLSSGIKIRV